MPFAEWISPFAGARWSRIMGPNGSGKTTLLNCLSGLDAIGGGEVLIEGVALSTMSDRERTDYRARRMGFVFFLIESSFIALTSIVVGTGLGLVLAENIIRDSQKQASWKNVTLVVPWLNLGLIFLVVYVVAMAATLAPAMKASRIRPAEALRYQ